jgi:hypothetical protein
MTWLGSATIVWVFWIAFTIWVALFGPLDGPLSILAAVWVGQWSFVVGFAALLTVVVVAGWCYVLVLRRRW